MRRRTRRNFKFGAGQSGYLFLSFWFQQDPENCGCDAAKWRVPPRTLYIIYLLRYYHDDLIVATRPPGLVSRGLKWSAGKRVRALAHVLFLCSALLCACVCVRARGCVCGRGIYVEVEVEVCCTLAETPCELENFENRKLPMTYVLSNE